MEYGEMEEGDEDERMIQFHTSIANETRHLQMKQEEIMYEKIHFKYRSLQTTIYMKLLLFGIGLCILAFSIVRYYTAKRNKTLRAIHKKNDD